VAREQGRAHPRADRPGPGANGTLYADDTLTNSVSAIPQALTKTLIKNGVGDLFGIITTQSGNGLIIANDGTNALDEVNM
jgi:DNA-binding beta-propeller fold protein YncE